MSLKDNSTDATMASIGSKTTTAGASVSIFGWLTSSDAGVVFGVIIGIVGLLINWWFKRRSDQREQAEHEALMKRLQDRGIDHDEFTVRPRKGRH